MVKEDSQQTQKLNITLLVLWKKKLPGPRDWKAFWSELTNPPADARHAIRKSGIPRFGIYPYQNFKMQYYHYVKSVEQSLSNQLKDQKSRVELVKQVFKEVDMQISYVNEVAYILASFNMYDTKPTYQKLLAFARIQFKENKIKSAFINKANDFVGHFQRVIAGRNN